MEKKRKSLRRQLIITTLATVLLVLFVNNYLNYRYGKQMLIEKIEESASNQSAIVNYMIRKKINQFPNLVSQLGHDVIYYNHYGDLDSCLYQIVRMYPMLDGLAVHLFADSDSNTYCSAVRRQDSTIAILKGQQNYKSLTDSVFLKKLNYRKSSLWSKVFSRTYDNLLVFSYGTPIKDVDGNIRGIITGQIKVHFFRQLLLNERERSQSFVFILTEDGDVMAEKKSGGGLINLNNWPDFSYALKEQMKGESGSGFIYPNLFDRARTWLHYSKIPETNWSIVILIPTSKLFRSLQVVFRETTIVSGIGLLLIAIILELIFYFKFKPLTDVIRSIQLFSFGNSVNLNGVNEIESLTVSLERLHRLYHFQMVEQAKNSRISSRLNRDLESARRIQLSVLPPDFQAFYGNGIFDIYARIEQAERIGGDFYDYFLIEKDHLAIIQGDVSGKGISAALLMAIVHTFIRTKATTLSARQIVSRVNEELSQQNKQQNFVTMLVGILNLKTGILEFCNAAHQYPLLIGSKGEIKFIKQTHGLPVGLFSDKDYDSAHYKLKIGDRLLLYSDGITDTRNRLEKVFGEKRFVSAIHELAELTPSEILDQLILKIKRFRGEAAPNDDISLLLIHYREPEE